MSNKPLVSVVTIFLNTEKFIQEAIESVLNQTYQNWELLLIDDGSTDNSTTIAQKYAKQYPEKIRYLEHENHQNRGKSTSRNLGISNARGEYIALLDADDVYLPEKLARQVEILESHHEAAMVYGPTQYWYSWTGNPQDSQRDFIMARLGVQLNTLCPPPTLLTLYLKDPGTVPCTCGLLVRRKVVEDVGGFDETIQHLYEDQVLLAKICLNTPVFVEGGCWDKYRQRDDSSWHISLDTTQDYYARFIFLNWLEKYLVEHGFKDTEVWQTLKTALFPYRHPTLYRLSKSAQNLKGRMKGIVKLIAHRMLPTPIHGRLKAQWQGVEYCPPVGKVKFGNLRRVTPLSQEFGFDRGLPIDRYYIEKFLTHCQDDIRGRVLEIGDDSYTRQFGGNRVICSDILHVTEGNSRATFVGDLTNADHIPSDSFDCLILTQTLHLIYDMRAALQTIYRILKPGGIALVTVPGISQIAGDEWGDYWCWSLTTVSARRLFEEVFPATNLKIETYGNVLAATAFLQGLATEELHQKELDYRDRCYEVTIAIRAVKPEVKHENTQVG